MVYVVTSASALRIRLGVPDPRLRNGKLIVKSARIGQVAVNEAWERTTGSMRAALKRAAELAYALNHFNVDDYRDPALETNTITVTGAATRDPLFEPDPKNYHQSTNQICPKSSRQPLLDYVFLITCGLALATSRSCNVTSCTTSFFLWTSPLGSGTYSSASRSNSVA